jgi:hypothetical protein
MVMQHNGLYTGHSKAGIYFDLGNIVWNDRGQTEIAKHGTYYLNLKRPHSVNK